MGTLLAKLLHKLVLQCIPAKLAKLGLSLGNCPVSRYNFGRSHVNEAVDELEVIKHCSIKTLHVDEADPRPVHDRAPHVDWHHIGSSPSRSADARPVHVLLVYVMYFFTL
jgi:hypothetical protein